jgi:hypothetical protein
MRNTYPQTPETIREARCAAAIERAEIYRQTGVVIDEDGTVHLPTEKRLDAVNAQPQADTVKR